MGLAGDGAGRRVADAVTGAGPGKLEATEKQQELQPTACSEHKQAHRRRHTHTHKDGEEEVIAHKHKP